MINKTIKNEMVQNINFTATQLPEEWPNYAPPIPKRQRIHESNPFLGQNTNAFNANTRVKHENAEDNRSDTTGNTWPFSEPEVDRPERQHTLGELREREQRLTDMIFNTPNGWPTDMLRGNLIRVQQQILELMDGHESDDDCQIIEPPPLPARPKRPLKHEHQCVRNERLNEPTNQSTHSYPPPYREEDGQRSQTRNIPPIPQRSYERQTIRPERQTQETGQQSRERAPELALTEACTKAMETMTRVMQNAGQPPRRTVDKQKLANFDGEKNNAYDYLKSVERVAKANNWDDHNIMDVIGIYMVGKARPWYNRTFYEGITWPEFVRKFKERFFAVDAEYDMLSLFNTATQQSGESGVEFIDRVLDLKMKTEMDDISDRRVIQVVKRGLYRRDYQQAIGLDVLTLNQVIEKVKMMDDIYFNTGSRSRGQTNNFGDVQRRG